jgi:hypothetical protein
VRAVSPLMATPVDLRRGVDQSVDAARMSACATDEQPAVRAPVQELLI